MPPLFVDFHRRHGCGGLFANVTRVRFWRPLLRMGSQHVCFHKSSLGKLSFTKGTRVLESLHVSFRMSSQMKLGSVLLSTLVANPATIVALFSEGIKTFVQISAVIYHFLTRLGLITRRRYFTNAFVAVFNFLRWEDQ